MFDIHDCVIHFTQTNLNFMKKYSISVFIILLSCTLSAQVTTKELADAYIKNYSAAAVREMQRSKVPASITLAQGMLESDYSRSKLAKESKNHFGIKCGKDWIGDKVYHDDDIKDDCFRKYNSVEESYADHSDFLSKRERYASLFELKKTDFKGWAHGLKKAGYATDPNYATRLIKIIEDNNLARFDTETSGVILKQTTKDSSKGVKKYPKKGGDKYEIDPFFSHNIEYNNGVKYINIKDGDTYTRISREFGLKSWELAKYNDLPTLETSDDLPAYLYISAKKGKAHPNHQTHLVKKGETLVSISNKYGIKLNKLLSYNELQKSSVLKEGTKLRLRSKK